MKLVGIFAAAAVLACSTAAFAQAPIPNGGPSISQRATTERSDVVASKKAVRRPMKRRRHRR